jgi:hypothetical protein
VTTEDVKVLPLDPLALVVDDELTPRAKVFEDAEQWSGELRGDRLA